MKNFTPLKKYIIIFSLPFIFLFAASFIGCHGVFVYSVEAYDDGDYDDCGCDDGDYDNGDCNDYGYDIIIIGSSEVTLVPINRAETDKRSLSKPVSTDIKYYEIEESNTSDFSNSNKIYNLHKTHFNLSNSSTLKKYYRARAVYTDSTSVWSNVVVSE